MNVLIMGENSATNIVIFFLKKEIKKGLKLSGDFLPLITKNLARKFLSLIL